MWFVPTRLRPHRLQKFLDGCVTTGMTMPGLIVVDGEDGGDYSGVRLPANWRIETAPRRAEVCGRMEAYFQAHPAAAFYSIVNDDVVPETPGWDVALAREAGDWNVAYPWDTLTVDKAVPPGQPWRGVATQFMVGGCLARAVGSFALGFLHTMVDRAWMDIGEGLGRLRFRSDIRLRHEHWARGLAPRDETYKRTFEGKSTILHDRERYNQWYRLELPTLISRLKTIVPAPEAIHA